MDTLETIRALPKAEQHIHLVGSTQPKTLLWLAEKGGIKVPFETVEEVRGFFSYTDFDHFIRVYSTVIDWHHPGGSVRAHRIRDDQG